MPTTRTRPARRQPRAPRIHEVATGEDYRITYCRDAGYALEFQGCYVGSFDRLLEAETARDEIAFDQLRRAA